MCACKHDNYSVGVLRACAAARIVQDDLHRGAHLALRVRERERGAFCESGLRNGARIAVNCSLRNERAMVLPRAEMLGFAAGAGLHLRAPRRMVGFAFRRL